MINFAVMGNPISHSLSPLIHQKFAQQTHTQLSYEKIWVPKEQFEAQVADFFAKGGKGLNITSPFKKRAYAMAHITTARATQAKAANTLWSKAQRLYADNTDGIGFIRDISRYLSVKKKHILLLGAGGAARGIIGPLLEAGVTQLIIANRSEAKANRLRADFHQIICNPLAEIKGCFDLIINATSASLNEEKILLPHTLLKSTTICYDLAYNLDEPTAFVQWAQEQGVIGVDGLGMLVEQAAEAFFIWNRVRPNTRALLEELRMNT